MRRVFAKNNRVNNRDFNIDRNNRDYDFFFRNRAALANSVLLEPVFA